MLKIRELIASLEEQEKKHGNIDISIEVLPRCDQSKEGFLNIYGTWLAYADDESGKVDYEFEFHEGEQREEDCDWLELLFIGRIGGEIEHLPEKDVKRL